MYSGRTDCPFTHTLSQMHSLAQSKDMTNNMSCSDMLFCGFLSALQPNSQWDAMVAHDHFHCQSTICCLPLGRLLAGQKGIGALAILDFMSSVSPLFLAASIPAPLQGKIPTEAWVHLDYETGLLRHAFFCHMKSPFVKKNPPLVRAFMSRGTIVRRPLFFLNFALKFTRPSLVRPMPSAGKQLKKNQSGSNNEWGEDRASHLGPLFRTFSVWVLINTFGSILSRVGPRVQSKSDLNTNREKHECQNCINAKVVSGSCDPLVEGRFCRLLFFVASFHIG